MLQAHINRFALAQQMQDLFTRLIVRLPFYFFKSLFGDKKVMPYTLQIFGHTHKCTITIHTSNNQQQQMVTLLGDMTDT